MASTSAMYTDSVEAANSLAARGIIVDKSSNIAEYRLGDTITRREMIKVAMQLSTCGDTVEVANVCEGKFADLKSSDWGCKYAEAALADGIVSANTYFRPNDNVSKAEALKMIMQSTDTATVADADWRAGYVKG